MRRSTKEIKKQFRQLYPKLREGERIWILDRWKTIPTEKELKEVLEITKVELMKLQDCDDYGLQLYAAVNKIDQSWAFGETSGFLNEAFTSVHSMNFCVCEEGIKIIEPTTDEIFKPDWKEYDIFFIRG